MSDPKGLMGRFEASIKNRLYTERMAKRQFFAIQRKRIKFGSVTESATETTLITTALLRSAEANTLQFSFFKGLIRAAVSTLELQRFVQYRLTQSFPCGEVLPQKKRLRPYTSLLFFLDSSRGRNVSRRTSYIVNGDTFFVVTSAAETAIRFFLELPATTLHLELHGRP